MIELPLLFNKGDIVADNDFVQALLQNPEDVQRILNTGYGEAAGGSNEEMIAVFSTILNDLSQKGDLDKVLNRYSAYRKESPQYLKASTGDLNAYEKNVYSNYGQILNGMLEGKINTVPNITHMENVDAFVKAASLFCETSDALNK